MGAWGSGPFENDDALDWASSLITGVDGAAIGQALIGVAAADGDTYVEAPEASVAIAAAEVVASLDGHRDDLPEDVARWLQEHEAAIGTDLTQTALRATERVSIDSELRQLWDASDEAAGWSQHVKALQERLARRLAG